MPHHPHGGSGGPARSAYIAASSLRTRSLTPSGSGSVTQTVASTPDGSNTPDGRGDLNSRIVLRLRGSRNPSPSSSSQNLEELPEQQSGDDDAYGDNMVNDRGEGAGTGSEAQTMQRQRRIIKRRARIQWAADVVDNEGLGRKRSKVCCIYHKPREVGESSSDESSSSSSSDDSHSDSDGGGSNSPGFEDGARMAGGRRKPTATKRGRQPGRHSDHDECDDHDHDHDHDHYGDSASHGRRPTEGKRKGKARDSGRKPSPNAYEKMPRYDIKPLEKQPSTT